MELTSYISAGPSNMGQSETDVERERIRDLSKFVPRPAIAIPTNDSTDIIVHLIGQSLQAQTRKDMIYHRTYHPPVFPTIPL